MWKPILKWFAAAAACLFCCAVAFGYTVVMRDGRRIEIPDHFSVSRAALTYEVAPGIQVTIMLANIDIEATEKANGEPPGSFLKRAASGSSGVPARRSKELTNEEINRARRARGQPPIGRMEEEQQRQIEQKNEAEAERLRLEAERRERERAAQETLLRERARVLREQIASVEGELAYWQAQLAELPTFPAGIIGSVTTVIGSPFVCQPFVPIAPIIFGPSRISLPPAGAGIARPSAIFTPPPVALARPIGIAPVQPSRVCVPTLVSVVAPLNQSYYYDRASIVARVQQLEATRAALLAQWRVLEDEARRAGVSPGTLR